MKKLGILVSGRGSNMRAILDACDQGKLSALVSVVISDNNDAEALKTANSRNINTVYLDYQTQSDSTAPDSAMKNALIRHDVDLVLLAGFIKKIGSETLSAFKGRVLNIHPALLPQYGGKGMYGIHVHKAVISAGEKETGVTIHIVDGAYDEGAVIARRTVKIDDADTPESLAKKVLRVEHILYPETVQKIIDGSIILPD